MRRRRARAGPARRAESMAGFADLNLPQGADKKSLQSLLEAAAHRESCERGGRRGRLGARWGRAGERGRPRPGRQRDASGGSPGSAGAAGACGLGWHGRTPRDEPSLPSVSPGAAPLSPRLSASPVPRAGHARDGVAGEAPAAPCSSVSACLSQCHSCFFPHVHKFFRQQFGRARLFSCRGVVQPRAACAGFGAGALNAPGRSVILPRAWEPALLRSVGVVWNYCFALSDSCISAGSALSAVLTTDLSTAVFHKESHNQGQARPGTPL